MGFGPITESVLGWAWDQSVFGLVGFRPISRCAGEPWTNQSKDWWALHQLFLGLVGLPPISPWTSIGFGPIISYWEDKNYSFFELTLN